LGDDFKVIFLGSTYTQVLFMEMLLKSRIQCECEKKTPLLCNMRVIYGRYMPALRNAPIVILHLKKYSHVDITSQNYQTSA